MGVTLGRPSAGAWLASSPAHAARRRRSRRRVVMALSGATLVLAGGSGLAAGGAMLWADQTQRTDGMVTIPQRQYRAPTHALVAEHIGFPDLNLGPVGPPSLLGRVRVEVMSMDRRPYFVGIGRPTDVERYLNGVSYSALTTLTERQQPEEIPGPRSPVPPRGAGIWAVWVNGSGSQLLSWSAGDGARSIVIMRTDGEAGIDVAVRAAATVPALSWLAGGACALGGVLLLCGLALLLNSASAARSPAGLG